MRLIDSASFFAPAGASGRFFEKKLRKKLFIRLLIGECANIATLYGVLLCSHKLPYGDG